jgi:hypothetical protein
VVFEHIRKATVSSATKPMTMKLRVPILAAAVLLLPYHTQSAPAGIGPSLSGAGTDGHYRSSFTSADGYKHTPFKSPVDGMDAVSVKYGGGIADILSFDFTVFTPKLAFSKTEKTFPTLMWFSDDDESRLELARVAEAYGLIAVFPKPTDGEWDIPRAFNDQTGAKCKKEDYEGMHAMLVLLADLQKRPQFDPNRLFLAGCKMGASMALYISTCIEETNYFPGKIAAIGTLGQGLKVKGDGNQFPFETALAGNRHIARENKLRTSFFGGLFYTPNRDLYQYGECPTCKYWPTYLDPKKHRDTKACIFDTDSNPSAADPFYYRSSVQLAKKWKALDRPVSTFFTDDHATCVPPSLLLLDCLNDQKGKLLRGVRIHLVLRTETAASFDKLHRRPLLTTALANMLSNGIRLQDCEFMSRSDMDTGGVLVHYTIRFRKSSSENIADIIADVTASRTFTGGIAADLQQHGWSIQAKDLVIAEDFQEQPAGQSSHILRTSVEVLASAFALSAFALAVSKSAPAMAEHETSEYGRNSQAHLGHGGGYNSVAGF